MDQSLSSRHQTLARWTAFFFVLAVIMLVGSVVVPADESRRVLTLLTAEQRLIEPLRARASQLISGVAEENAELQRYVRVGDLTALARYRDAADRDERRAAEMRRLSAELGEDVAADADTVQQLVKHWRVETIDGAEAHPSLSRFAADAERREATRDSIVVATTRLQSKLADWSMRERSAIAAHEWRGIVVNASLVFVAVAALAGVFDAMRRERRRAEREAALRRAAEMLARAYAVPDVAQQTADGAMQLLRPDRVFVAQAEAGTGEMRMAALAPVPSADAVPEQLPAGGVGPVMDRVIRDGRPTIVGSGDVVGQASLGGRAMIIPFGTPEIPVGAVVAFESPDRRFQHDDVAAAEIFAHLAYFAYEKVRLLDEARAGRAKLQRAMESRGRLIRGFSHDVKNPLGAADGYAALLQDGIYGSVTAEQERSIARVREAVHRALSLIDDLHELARAETGHLDIRLQSTDFGALVSTCVEEYRAAAEAKHLGFTLEIDAQLPLAETDPSRVRQILGNLLSNAIKYTAAGGIVLRARSDQNAGSDDIANVLIEVQDTGPGIPKDKQERIFEEFMRIADGNHSGAGLGLAISKHVAEALGCTLLVRSDLGEGATFALRIPVRSAAVTQSPRAEQAAESSVR